VGVEVVGDQPNDFGICVSFVNEHLHESRKVPHRSSFCNLRHTFSCLEFNPFLLPHPFGE
jgi:hypothetical protein